MVQICFISNSQLERTIQNNKKTMGVISASSRFSNHLLVVSNQVSELNWLCNSKHGERSPIHCFSVKLAQDEQHIVSHPQDMIKLCAHESSYIGLFLKEDFLADLCDLCGILR